MAKTGATGLTRVINAWDYSKKGLAFAWKNEAAFRQECMLGIFAVPGAFFLGGDAVGISLLLAVTFLVMIIELLNTGIEAVVDRIGDEPHALSGHAKDLGSAAVLVSLGLWLIVWILVVGERQLGFVYS